MQRLLSPLRQIGKPSSSTASISPAESKFKVMVELMLPQVVPLPTEPAVIATSFIGKIRVAMVEPLAIFLKTTFGLLVSIVRLTLLPTRASCCTCLMKEASASLLTLSSKVLTLANLLIDPAAKIPSRIITTTSSTMVNPSSSEFLTDTIIMDR